MKDATTGNTNALPCPWCKELLSNLDDAGGIEVDCVLECDYCGKLIQITSISTITHCVAERYEE